MNKQTAAGSNGSDRTRRGRDEPIRVGIAGLGRSGWNIHAKTLRSMPESFEVTRAMDVDATRREQAATELGAKPCVEYEELLAADVDAVVIASPSDLHAEHMLLAAEAGKHVIVEKPFALTMADADRMIAAADRSGLILAPFQNRRFESHYRTVLDLVRDGALGEVLQVRMCWHRFTRRWDWQALRKFGGGALYNNGSHLIDQALEFFPDDDFDVFVDTRRGLCIGDAHEHMKLVLRASSGPTIDIEYTNAAAFEQPRWHIMGTGGGLIGDLDWLEWKSVDWDKMPTRSIETGAARGRLYPSEEIVWAEHAWKRDPEEPTPYERFYRNFRAAVLEGAPLVVTPASVRRYVALLTRCERAIAESASAGGDGTEADDDPGRVRASGASRLAGVQGGVRNAAAGGVN